MKNHTFAVAILVVEMTCNITKLMAILQVLPSKTFDNFLRNDIRKCLLCVSPPVGKHLDTSNVYCCNELVWPHCYTQVKTLDF